MDSSRNIFKGMLETRSFIQVYLSTVCCQISFDSKIVSEEKQLPAIKLIVRIVRKPIFTGEL